MQEQSVRSVRDVRDVHTIMSCSAMISDTAPSKTVKHPFMNMQKRTTPCFHCNTNDDKYPRVVPLIRDFDIETQKYIVGPELFCCLACAKAYILAIYSLGARELRHLSQYATAYLGFQKPIEPAPPKAWLTTYGGPIHMEGYREGRLCSAKRFVDPPYIPRHTIFEDFETEGKDVVTKPCIDLSQLHTSCSSYGAAPIIKSQRATHKTGLFAAFVTDKVNTKKRKRTVKDSGIMSQFLRS